MRTYWPRFHSTHWNGPLPMIGGSFWKLVPASFPGTFDHTCLGTTKSTSPSMLALGLLQTKRTVSGSMTSTFLIKSQ